MSNFPKTVLLSLVLLPLYSYASNLELSNDIKNIANSSMVKNELETTVEFNERVKQLYKKYSNKKYKINIEVNKPLYSKHKYLKYNADTSVLTFSLPKLERRKHVG